MSRPVFLSLIAAAALLGALGVAGAQMRFTDEPEKPKPMPPLQKTFPLDQTFSLRELDGKPVASSLDISLKIDSALHASGFAGCASWSAVMYPIKDQHLLTGQFAPMRKQCDKDTMEIQSKFLSSLLGSPTWDLVNGDLVIKGPRGAMRMVRSL